MDYKQMIIEVLDTVENEKLYEYLYGLISSLVRKWG